MVWAFNKCNIDILRSVNEVSMPIVSKVMFG